MKRVDKLNKWNKLSDKEKSDKIVNDLDWEIKNDLDPQKELEYAVSILDEAYSKVLSIVRSDDDHETINIIQPILDKIDEIQNEIESLT